MRKNIKILPKINFKILLIIAFFILFTPSVSLAAKECYCYDENSEIIQKTNGDSMNKDDCNQFCANLGAEKYNLNSWWGGLTYNVTKTPATSASTSTSTSTSTSANKYTPMEAIPGFDRPEKFPEYLMSIYKFGLGAVGISAMFMIMIGGYIYLTSAGNNTQTSKAKAIITDAIIGLILALTSYLILYTINPDLVEFKLLGNQTSTGASIEAVNFCPFPD